MKTVTEQWLKAAEDDLRVMARIASDEYLAHMVAFHSQQCIEKSLKAIIEEYELGHIRIHNLGRLFEVVRPKVIFDADEILIEKLDKLYIDARYAGELGLLPNGKPTRADAQQFYDCARSIHEQVKRVLAPRW
ncbi:MAG: HEPN domain-containing protein [Planctomycetes bacterium]|nr:HEPN domain-containing protein [Planctomycetota bacterium]